MFISRGRLRGNVRGILLGMCPRGDFPAGAKYSPSCWPCSVPSSQWIKWPSCVSGYCCRSIPWSSTVRASAVTRVLSNAGRRPSSTEFMLCYVDCLGSRSETTSEFPVTRSVLLGKLCNYVFQVILKQFIANCIIDKNQNIWNNNISVFSLFWCSSYIHFPKPYFHRFTSEDKPYWTTLN